MVKLDGATMSKSRGNVVAPEEMIAKYGADALRAYILFMAPPDKDLDWSFEGLEGMWRFLNRAWRIVDEIAAETRGRRASPRGGRGPAEKALRRAMHASIAKCGDDIAALPVQHRALRDHGVRQRRVRLPARRAGGLARPRRCCVRRPTT